MALTDKLTAIANAIRAAAGITGKLTLTDMPAQIRQLGTVAALEKEIRFDATTAESAILATAEELVAAGIIPDASTAASAVWNNIRCEIKASTTDFEHTFKQVVYARADTDLWGYASGNNRRKFTLYHTSASNTACSIIGNSTDIGTAYNGMLSIGTTANFTATTTYTLGPGVYKLSVVCWGKK